jgi:putative two-component system response regulator
MENVFYYPQNILVVDDIAANLIALTEMIRKAGFIARPVTSVKQALSAIEALTPDLILLDISMPDIDGFTFCNMLKTNANTRNIPVIFISALNSTEDKIKGFQLGAVDYIAKPFEIEEVTLRVNTHLKMHKMQKELEAYNKKLYKIINDQIKKIYDEQKNVIYALAKLLEKLDSFVPMHLDRIGLNSRILAMSLQLTPIFQDQITNSFIDAIELASLLHDIGKIELDKRILQKTELTQEEVEVLKTHTILGSKTLEEIFVFNKQNEFLKMAIDIAKYHHEYWNGEGFPFGIAGNNIPLSARIVSVVDNYDILICGRYNQISHSHEDSIRMINKGAGIQFDPNIVAVFNKIQHQLKKI